MRSSNQEFQPHDTLTIEDLISKLEQHRRKQQFLTNDARLLRKSVGRKQRTLSSFRKATKKLARKEYKLKKLEWDSIITMAAFEGMVELYRNELRDNSGDRQGRDLLMWKPYQVCTFEQAQVWPLILALGRGLIECAEELEVTRKRIDRLLPIVFGEVRRVTNV